MALCYIKVPPDDASISREFIEPALLDKSPICPDPLTATPCDVVKNLNNEYGYDIIRCIPGFFIPGEWLVYDDDPKTFVHFEDMPSAQNGNYRSME